MHGYRTPLLLASLAQDPLPALHRAIRLTAGSDARLTLVQVRPGVPRPTREVLSESLLAELVQALREEQDDPLGSLERTGWPAGVTWCAARQQVEPGVLGERHRRGQLEDAPVQRVLGQALLPRIQVYRRHHAAMVRRGAGARSRAGSRWGSCQFCPSVTTSFGCRSTCVTRAR